VAVTADRFASALVDRGLDETEREAKRVLSRAVLDRHAHVRGEAPDHVWWVPGRLEVFGKHTDYAGGRTLVCPVPRGFAVAASRRADGVVRAIDAGRGQDVVVGPPKAGTPAGWGRYVEVAVRRLQRNFPAAAFGADIVFASDVPSACGMSSSSALVVAVATALARIAGLQDHPAWRAAIRDDLDAAAYFACIENGASFRELDGNPGVGTHGGSEDHTAILAGRPGYVSAFRFVPPSPLGSAAVPGDWRFAIAPSGVAARKIGAAQAPYNRLSAATRLLIDAWNRSEPRAASLGAALCSGESARSRLLALAEAAATPEASATWLRDRLEHFIREDGRVLPALEAFAHADAAALTALAESSQRDAETLLRNQVPASSALARSARSLGAFAACSFGAGFGGAVWALVPASSTTRFVAAWQPGAFLMTPGPPLTDLSGV